MGGEELEEGRVFVSYVESWLTTLPPFMVGVPELFLERPCFSPISCSDGSLYMHTAKRKDTVNSPEVTAISGHNELFLCSRLKFHPKHTHTPSQKPQ